MQVAAEQQAATVSVSDVPVPIPSGSGTSMDVDVPVNGEGRSKRKADESLPAESSKKARIGRFIIYFRSPFLLTSKSKEQKPPPLKRCVRKMSL